MPNRPAALHIRGINLLSLDGGGVTGLSSLYILREIMDRLQARHSLPTRPEPWEHFDMIAGTGTGAVSAIMLGRLRLGMDDTIRLYHQLMSDTFSARRRVARGPGFKEANLEEGLKKIIYNATGDAEETLLGNPPQITRCKVVIYAMSAYNMNAGLPCAFRTYSAIPNVMPNCPIWKALRASMANPELFKSFTIEEDGLKHEFIGGGLGGNNPTAELLKEAGTLFPTQYVSCVVSVGAGHAQTIQLPEPSTCGILSPFGQPLSLRLLRVARRLAEDSERVAESMATRFSSMDNFYFRLNVNQGMQSIRASDWEKQNVVAGHATAYLRSTEVNSHLGRLVETLEERRALLTTNQISGRIDNPSPRVSRLPNIVDHGNNPDSYPGSYTPASPKSISARFEFCQRPTFMFKGRRLQLEQAGRYFGNDDEMQHVFVLHGLGGAGKTQTALKCAECMAERFEGVIFIDGSSRNSIEVALSQFAVAKHLGEEYTDTLRWFRHSWGRWMLLFDNVDDPEVRVQDYFPQTDAYDVLITTRSMSVARQARGSDSLCKIDRMGAEEALELLLESAKLQKDALEPGDVVAAGSLLEELGYLALAIVQCGAFIRRTHRTITQYYELYLSERWKTLEGGGRITMWLDDYERSVFTTWALNEPLISEPTKRLWNLFVHMHRNSISEGIFRRAFEIFPGYTTDIPPTEFELTIRQDVIAVLEMFSSSEGTWSSSTFALAMGELVDQSMINLDEANNVYQLHPLVQQWARATVSEPNALEKTSFLLALSIDIQRRTDDAYRRTISPHIFEMLNLRPEPNPNDAWQFAAIYRTMGDSAKAELLEAIVIAHRTKELGPEHPSTIEAISYAAITKKEMGLLEEAETMHSRVLDFRQREFGSNHPSTLSSMANLAVTYCDQGRFEEAELLQIRTLDAQREVLGDDHPHTLSNMANLAATQFKQGRIAEAELLGSEVLDARKHVLGENHPNTLQSMANLALIYSEQGRLIDAELLGVQVLAASRQVLGEDHPNTLISKENLALTYGEQGRLADSESLEIEVLAARKRVLGKDHPETLLSMANLAAGYFKQGRLVDAESLETEVMDTRKRVLGEDHPNTLLSMANLALTYFKQGRPADAHPLEVAVLNGRRRILGDSHPDTLQSMVNLGLTYSELDRLEDAESIEVAVLAARTRLLGEDHPDTLQSMANLAATYYKQNRLADAERLETRVMTKREEVLGKDHPDTLSSMANLAETYESQGRLKEVELLEVKLVATRKVVLGDDHPDTLSSMTNLAATYYRQGRLADAEALESEALDSRKRVLPQDHPDTLQSMGNLVNVYYRQDRWTDVEPLQIELIAAKQRTLGHEHPGTLKTMQDLGIMYVGEGRLTEAESLEVEVLAGYKRVLGNDDPDTLLSMANLARIYHKQGRIEDAESLGLEVLVARKRVLGEDHPETIKSAQHLAMIGRSKTQTTNRKLSWSTLTSRKAGTPRH